MIRLIIFDFDGTLVNSREAGIKMYNRLADKYHTKKIEDVDALLRLSLLERFKTLSIPLVKLPRLIAEMRQEYKHSLADIALFPGVRELLLEVNERGYLSAVISSNSESNIRDYFRQQKVDVGGPIMSSANLWGKDKAIKKLLARQELTPSEVLYVGDEVRDIEACRKAGVKIVCVAWGYDPADMLREGQPDYIVAGAEDILPILLAT